MHKLKFLGAVAATAMMASALAPSSAQATIEAYADFVTSNIRITDSAGNKLDSSFFSDFNSTVTLDPRAILRGTTDDPTTTIGFNKTDLESGTGDLPLTQENAFVSGINANDFASGTSSVEDNIIDRAGESNTNATGTTNAEVSLDADGDGSADSQVLLQVFDFTIDPAAAGVDAGDTVNLRVSFDADLELRTRDEDLTDGLLGTSPWSATSSFALSAVDADGNDVFGTELGDGLDLLNRSRALGSSLSPQSSTHTVEFAFTAGVEEQFSLDQQVRVRATTAREVPIPATLMLFGTGLLGLGFVTRQTARRRQRTA